MPPPPPLRHKSARASRRSLAPAVLTENYVVAGKYRLAERIGTGSMGSVWRADHVMLGHSVAIKFMHASVDAYPEGRVRFEREAMLSARLGEECPHICKVTDYGVLDSTIPFVVMELLRGEELLTRLKREQRLSLEETAGIVSQLCKALTVAHAGGVVHRDLKPANVFLCHAEESSVPFVKLLDFGVAKADLEHEETQGTSAGTIFGTPGYMSPEQIMADAAIDQRADLWSVVVLAYRMVIGKTPFGSGNLRELGMRILTTEAVPPRELRPDLPPAFDAWVRKGLSKQREERFGSAAELSSALAAVLESADPNAPAGPQAVAPPRAVAPPQAVVPPRAQSVPPHAEDAGTYDAMSHSAQPPPRSAARWRRTGPVVLAVAGGFALVTAALLTRDPPKAALREVATEPAAVALDPSATEPESAQKTEPTEESAPAAPEALGEPQAAAAAAQPSVPEAGVAPATETPASVAAAPGQAAETEPAPASPPAKRAPATRTARPAKAPSPAIEERAAALWNKKDEL